MTDRDKRMQRRTLHMYPDAAEFGVILQKAPPPKPSPESASAKTAAPKGSQKETAGRVLRPVYGLKYSYNKKAAQGTLENPFRISKKKEAVEHGYRGFVMRNGQKIEFEFPPWPADHQLFFLEQNGDRIYFVFQLDVSSVGCIGCLPIILGIILSGAGIVFPPLFIGLLVVGIIILIIGAVYENTAKSSYEKAAAQYRQQHRL